MEDSNWKLWYDSMIHKGEHKDVGNNMKLEGSNIKHRQLAERDGAVHGAMEMMEVQRVEYFHGDHAALRKEDEREKDRVFWETCLASGYP